MKINYENDHRIIQILKGIKQKQKYALNKLSLE